MVQGVERDGIIGVTISVFGRSEEANLLTTLSFEGLLSDDGVNYVVLTKKRSSVDGRWVSSFVRIYGS